MAINFVGAAATASTALQLVATTGSVLVVGKQLKDTMDKPQGPAQEPTQKTVDAKGAGKGIMSSIKEFVENPTKKEQLASIVSKGSKGAGVLKSLFSKKGLK